MIELYDHQADAIKRMKNGCILCGRVGSGKSRTALAYYYILNGGDLNFRDKSGLMKNPKDLYIITTARKRDTRDWEFECAPFLISSDPECTPYKNKVIIDSWNNIKKYISIEDAFFIFDEQRVIGKGKWAKSFIRISKANDWILLSATPGDTWMDYWAVFVANGFYKNLREFNHAHVIFNNYAKFPQIDHYTNIARLESLRDSILVDMDDLRVTKEHHIDIYVEYDIRSYKHLLRTRWNIWNDQPFINAGELCYGLRRVVNSDESRLIKVLEIVESNPRVIIFYNFDYELELLRNLYYGDDIKIAEWNGHKHEVIPSSEKWVYLVQYTAGAEGWNCTETDTIIFYSQSYSYKVTVQSSGRINRINTKYTDLYYYHLKSKAPIDIAISRALKQKKNFNEKMFIERKGNERLY